MENIQVPLPPTVPPPSYLLTLAYLVSHSSRGIEQGQGRGACTRYVCYGKIVAGIYIDT